MQWYVPYESVVVGWLPTRGRIVHDTENSRKSDPDSHHAFSRTTLLQIGGFISFILVFYVNQSSRRFFDLYGLSMACKGRIFDAASIAVTTLPEENASRLVRFMNAAHVAGYVGLSETYPSSTFFAEMNKDLGLLTDKELSRMNDINLDMGGSCNRELIAWCMKEVQTVQKAGIVDEQLASLLRKEVLQLQGSIGKLYNAADLPIPFFYVHFICLLSALYLPLFAISAGYNAGTGDEVFWTSDVLSGLVVILQVRDVIQRVLMQPQLSCLPLPYHYL